MKHDITKAIQFSNTFRYIDDLFSINNVDFGNYISAIYPPELQLTDTSTSSTEVCYLDTHIKTGDTNTPFRISIYDKRDDFTFRIVNFPYMDSNIPANPAYGVYISQLVRYARICTSKVDFMNRLRRLSLRLRQQGFLTNLLQRTFTKFFNRHGLIVVKYVACVAGARKGEGKINWARAKRKGRGRGKRLQPAHCLFRLASSLICKRVTSTTVCLSNVSQ